MDDYDIIWQVVFCKETIGKGVVKGMFKTFEDAKMRCKELVYDHECEDNYDMFHKWEYYVRGISMREYMNERQAIYEQLMRKANAIFWDHCDEHFEECCRCTLEKLREYNNSGLWTYMN